MFKRQQQGFILLFVLAIMSLLALLLGSISTQNYILHLHMQREFAEQQAKNNALFALKLALARLQEFAGKDNVVSIKAGNFSDALDIHDFSAENTIGLWATTNENHKYNHHFLCWLNSEYNSNDINSLKILSNKDAIRLMNNNSHEIYTSKRNFDTIKNKESCEWCFWIDDESQKIDLSLIDAYKQSEDKILSEIYPQRPGVEEVTTVFKSYKPNLKIYKYIDFLEQFSLIDATLGANIINNNNLCTLHTYGVLSKQHGLKKELNQFLQDTHFSATDYIFNGQNNIPVPPPTWKFLQSFVNLQNRQKQSSISVSPTGPIFHPRYLQDYSFYTLHNLHKDLQPSAQHGVYPVVTQITFDIIAAINNDKLVIKICPKFALWNPYNISLQLSEYQLDINIFSQQIRDTISLAIVGKDKISNTTSMISIINLCSDNIDNYLRHFWGLKIATNFKPGEVKIFSLNQDYETSDIRITHAISGDYDNYFILPTDINVNDFSEFFISLTDQNGIQNVNWDSFYIRLLTNNIICQEISQISPGKKLPESQISFIPTEHKKTLLSFSAQLKIANLEDTSENTGIRWLIFGNPRAPCINRALFQDPASIFFGQDFISDNWSWKTKYTFDRSTLDYNQLNFLHNLILFDIPYKNYGIPNLTFLRHVNWTPFGYLPTYSLGNSNHNPYLPTSATFTQNPSSGIWPSHAKVEALFDYSYLLNEALFDNFYCLPQPQLLQRSANQRIKQLSSTQEMSAENILIKGNFNVHTNSYEPWLAYLSTIKDEQQNIIFPRILNQQYTKLPCQKFKNYEIINLAKNITQLIKKRHLFETLSIFINRQLCGENTLCGLLQQAIFNSELNKRVERQYVTYHKNKTWFNDKAASGYIEAGLPNVVDQADVLQTISHFISTRGDTFKIIAYGKYVNKQNKKLTVIKKCEAIAQRLPEFLNPYDNAPTDEHLSHINQMFGRKFQIILFRWCD